jgi:7,8-dihydro-6-hydroxymethylpterin-pyrophosphokinase
MCTQLNNFLLNALNLVITATNFVNDVAQIYLETGANRVAKASAELVCWYLCSEYLIRCQNVQNNNFLNLVLQLKAGLHKKTFIKTLLMYEFKQKRWSKWDNKTDEIPLEHLYFQKYQCQ